MSTGHSRVTPEAVTPPGIDRLPSGSLRVRVYGPDGKRRLVGTYPTLREAKDAHAKARADLLGGSYVERKRGQVTVDSWFQLWMPDRGVRPNTLHKDWERYRLHIKPYLGDLQLNKITPYQVSTWLGRLERDGRSVALRKKAHTLLSTALGVHGAVGDQRLAVNPCQIVRAPLPDRPKWRLLTRPQFDRLLEKAPEWLRLPMQLAAFAGLRWSEIAGLQARDYDRTRKELTVARGLTYTPKEGLRVGLPKSKKSRTVPLPPLVVEALNQHLTLHPTVGNGWLITLDNQPVALYRQTAAWKKTTTAAGIACRFHDLRHSCASWLLAAGMTTAEVKDILGHASITTTELYLHTDDTTLADKMAQAFG